MDHTIYDDGVTSCQFGGFESVGCDEMMRIRDYTIELGSDEVAVNPISMFRWRDKFDGLSFYGRNPTAATVHSLCGWSFTSTLSPL